MSYDNPTILVRHDQVRVNCRVPHTLSRGRGTPWLLRHGVPVRAVASLYIHAKAVIVDGREAFVGSENLSTTSLDQNREIGILIRGPDVATLERIFARNWSSGR